MSKAIRIITYEIIAVYNYLLKHSKTSLCNFLFFFKKFMFNLIIALKNLFYSSNICRYNPLFRINMFHITELSVDNVFILQIIKLMIFISFHRFFAVLKFF